MNRFLFTLCLLFNLTSVFSQQDTVGIRTNDEIVILDTVLFEGMLVVDFVNQEVYFVEKQNVPEFESNYKSNKQFRKHFSKTEKLNYLDGNDLKLLLLKYTDFECTGESNQLHSAELNGIAVYSEGEYSIYLSLLSLHLVKARVKRSVVNTLMCCSHLAKNPEEYIITYSFMKCGWGQ